MAGTTLVGRARRLAGWLGICAGAALLAAQPVAAHPHIFIDATAVIAFDENGAVRTIRNEWTFDEAFSAWQVQGLDVDEDGAVTSAEMQELADENMIGLAEYGYYTFAGVGPQNLSLTNGRDPRFRHEGGRSTLSFEVDLAVPHPIVEPLEIAISDPEYYVAITFADAGAVRLENAPAGCEARLEAGRDMPVELAEQLYALPPDVTVLPPELAAALRGVQGAIVVTCPEGSARSAPVATTALEATEQLAATPMPGSEWTEAQLGALAPFGGPPPEPGLSLPRTGLFGWIAEQQRAFYQQLTGALATLREDNLAFWVLGSLSFLYGVFHAAGPGHGKVVVSSYVLANERQLRGGIVLSFAAAMVQALVAIALVLVVAAVFNLTASALSNVANWIGIASYGLVMVLGLWLLARKLFGWGHRHRPAGHGHDHHHHHHHHRHDHEHDHDHDHGEAHAHHMVTPDQVRGNWREQLGVVLAVGLRPCSGALVVLAFSFSQGLLGAGILAVLLMGLGTGLTVAVLASLAVGIKGFAAGAAGANDAMAARLVWWAEVAGALLVFGFGLVLLLASL